MNRKYDAGAFDRMLLSLLLDMQANARLVTYLEGCGDVLSEIREDLNNEILDALDKEAAAEKEEEAEEEVLAVFGAEVAGEGPSAAATALRERKDE